MEVFFIGIIGLCIGSFLNVCICRIAEEESIIFPPSHCTNCEYELMIKDLIPVFSYVLLGGRCRKCKEKISIKYPLVEIFNATIYILIYLQYGLSVELVKYALFTSLMIVIGFIDFETKFVFSSTIIFGVVSGVLFLIVDWIIGKQIPWTYLAGAAIGFGVIWIIVELIGGMGEGDIDIALICGLFLGIKGIAVTLFLAFVSGGIVATYIIVLKLKERNIEMAFGPYLSLGGIIAMLYSVQIINLYLGTL